jgi:hypothetical protein
MSTDGTAVQVAQGVSISAPRYISMKPTTRAAKLMKRRAYPLPVDETVMSGLKQL